MYVSHESGGTSAAHSTTSYNYNEQLQTWLDGYLETFFGVFLLSCALWGSPANLLALVTFWRKGKGLVARHLFVWTTFLDTLICTSCLLAALPYFANRKEMAYRNSVICNVTGFVWNVASRMSVLIVVLISCTRVLFSLFPLWSQVHRQVLTTAIQLTVIFFLVACIAKSSLPYFYHISYSFNVYLGMCNFYYDEIFYRASTEFLVLTAVYTIDFVLPLLPISIGAIVTIFFLFQRTKPKVSLNKECRAQRLEEAKKKSITILIYVWVYAFCNLPVGAVYSYQLLSEFSEESEQYTLFNSPKISLYVLPAGLVLSVALNSAINPIIFYSRQPDLHLSFRSRNSVNKMKRVIAMAQLSTEPGQRIANQSLLKSSDITPSPRKTEAKMGPAEILITLDSQ